MPRDALTHFCRLSSNLPECQEWGGGVKPILAMPGFWELFIQPQFPNTTSTPPYPDCTEPDCHQHSALFATGNIWSWRFQPFHLCFALILFHANLLCLFYHLTYYALQWSFQSSRISSLIVYGWRDTHWYSGCWRFVNLSLFTRSPRPQKLRRTLICDHQLQILEDQRLTCWIPETIVRALWHPWLMLNCSLQ